ncbi:hypothetical protein YSA_05697 [Pseudomonas putida ND6]|uniref:Uncharacterized protein n=1 Tax=Pseudomonas putida ND6 TaxID=231023 RepID=I3UWI4_PSEPU|nr:hypothetical protein YSA_05697 [Pseudomonas putida ND6]
MFVAKFSFFSAISNFCTTVQPWSGFPLAAFSPLFHADQG